MAKKLSKALRGKRRWFGVAVSPQIETRKELENSLEKLQVILACDKKLRLMDFFNSGSEVTKLAHTNLSNSLPSHSLQGAEGFAIIQVPHEVSAEFRKLIDNESGYSEYSMLSISMSGKIRLIRQRLNLPKPKRTHR
jgi:hypothetical protein